MLETAFVVYTQIKHTILSNKNFSLFIVSFSIHKSFRHANTLIIVL